MFRTKKKIIVADKCFEIFFNLFLKNGVNGHIANTVLVIWPCMKKSKIIRKISITSKIFILNTIHYIRNIIITIMCIMGK